MLRNAEILLTQSPQIAQKSSQTIMCQRWINFKPRIAMKIESVVQQKREIYDRLELDLKPTLTSGRLNLH